MEEKVIIKSERYDVKKLFLIIVIVGAVISALWALGITKKGISNVSRWYDEDREDYILHQENGHCNSSNMCSYCERFEEYPPKPIYVITEFFDWYETELLISLIPFAALSLIGALAYFWLHSYELTVTDKRIYGTVGWGKRVDLPVDSVSATATISLLKGVSVSTSSGRISFLVIKNADEIYKTMSDLLIERQQKKTVAAAEANIPGNNEAEQLKKLKELLDCGVITKEEFDAKKKQLLGL